MFLQSGNNNNLETAAGLLATNPENRFNIVYLKAMHKILMENKIITSENEKAVVEILRIIAEMTVYGDSNSEILFDFFCEKNMMAIFLDIMMIEQGNCPVSVLIQILQTLSILISCVRNDTSLYYLLSNNRINQVIVFPYNLSVDESLRDHYVSFLKTLSMRLNKQTVNFLYIESASSFPLLTQAIKLLSIDENMSKIAAQTIILNIYQIDHEGARKYALQEVMIRSLCKKIVGIMINQYKQVVCKLYENMVTNVSALAERSYVSFYNHISDIFAAVEDWLYYIVDLLGLNIPDISSSIILTVVNEFVLPFLVHPFSAKPLDQQFATSPGRDDSSNKNLFSSPINANGKFASPKKTIAPIIESYVDSQTKETKTTYEKLKKRRTKNSSGKKSPAITEDSKQLADSDDDNIDGEEDDDDDDEDEGEGFDNNVVGTGRSSVRSFEDTDFYPEFYSDGRLNPAKEHLKFAVAIAFLTRLVRVVPDFNLHTQILAAVMHPLNCESIQEVLHQRIISPVVALADMTKEPSCIETNTDKSAAIDVHATVSGADDSFVEERHPLDESIDDSADIASGLAPKVSIAVSPIPGNFSPNSRLGSPIATSQSGATGGVNVFRQTLEQLLSLFIVAPDSDEQMRRRHLVSMLPLPLSDYSGVAVLVLRMYRVIFESLASETTFNAKVENPNQNSSSNDMKLQQSLQLLAGIHAFPSNSAYIPSTLTNKMSPRSPIRDPFSHDTFHHDHLTLKDLDEVRRVITSQLVNPQSVLSQNKVKDTFKSHVNFLLYSPVASTMTYLEVVHSLCAISKCAYYCCFESARTNDRNSLTPTNSRRLSREIKNESISRDRSASVTINDTSLTLLKSCLEQVEATKNALVSSLLAYHPSESDISSVEALDTWQEEVHRLVDHSWSHLAQTNSGDLNLLVSLAPSMRDRFDHFPLFCESASLPSLPLSLFYRSLVQRFILVRSLHRFVAKLLACAEGGDLVGTSIDDITIGLIDDNLLPFAGQISIPSELRVGAAINMKGKKFLEAATYLPVTPDVVPVAPARKESTTSKLQDRAYSAFGLLRASPSKGKLSKSPAPSANVTPVANLTKKLTEVLLVQDSIAFLLVRIIKGTEYEVLMSVPISQIRDVTRMQDHRSKIRVELASWDKLTNLTPNGSSTVDSTDSNAKESKSISSPPPTARTMVSSLDTRLGAAKAYDDVLNGTSPVRDTEPRCEVVLVFDSENTCNLALKYLQSKSKLARDSKLADLRSLLEGVVQSQTPYSPKSTK